jgi:hypothetical protein
LEVTFFDVLFNDALRMFLMKKNICIITIGRYNIDGQFYYHEKVATKGNKGSLRESCIGF